MSRASLAEVSREFGFVLWIWFLDRWRKWKHTLIGLPIDNLTRDESHTLELSDLLTLTSLILFACRSWNSLAFDVEVMAHGQSHLC